MNFVYVYKQRLSIIVVYISLHTCFEMKQNAHNRGMLYMPWNFEWWKKLKRIQHWNLFKIKFQEAYTTINKILMEMEILGVGVHCCLNIFFFLSCRSAKYSKWKRLKNIPRIEAAAGMSDGKMATIQLFFLWQPMYNVLATVVSVSISVHIDINFISNVAWCVGWCFFKFSLWMNSLIKHKIQY